MWTYQDLVRVVCCGGGEGALRINTALHCTELHCTELHCTELHCTVLHCTALHYTSLRCTVLHCNALVTALQFTALHCIARLCTVLHSSALQSKAINCTALCCTEIYFTLLHCLLFHCSTKHTNYTQEGLYRALGTFLHFCSSLLHFLSEKIEQNLEIFKCKSLWNALDLQKLFLQTLDCTWFWLFETSFQTQAWKLFPDYTCSTCEAEWRVSCPPRPGNPSSASSPSGGSFYHRGLGESAGGGGDGGGGGGVNMCGNVAHFQLATKF